MTDPLTLISTRRTPQSETADPRQMQNRAGGYTFQVDDLTRLRRFLTLGTTSGTYYASEREHTRENADLILDLARTQATDVVSAVVEISTAGRAPKQNPALFALAAAAKLGDLEGRRAAHAALPQVARTGTHLFTFVGYVEQFGGWGRGTRRAVRNWYLDKDIKDLAYQVAKYRQRDGWSQRDLLRLSHPDPTGDCDYGVIFDWVCGRRGETGIGIVDRFERAQAATTSSEIVSLITSGRGLSWEMIPDQFLNEPSVWEALLENGVPQTALMRQLPRLTRLGLLAPMGLWASRVAAQLADPNRLIAAKVHPVNVLIAQRTYASGHSVQGGSTWTPSRPIVDALDAAFYAAYGAVEPAGKRMLLALDVSGSMGSPVSGLPLSCREAAGALALVTAATEPSYDIVAFSDGKRGGRYVGWASSGRWQDRSMVTPLTVSPKQRLDDVVRTIGDLNFGRTDCALPMLHALKNRLEVDAFVIYTDNETWFGEVHPHQALREYRERMGIDARLIVVAMTATGSTIADPADPGMLDISGFDSAVPGLISDFARGL